MGKKSRKKRQGNQQLPSPEQGNQQQPQQGAGMAASVTDEQSAEFKKKLTDLLDQAKGLLYGENYDAMVNLFVKNGRKGFSDAMGLIVVGTLDRLEKDNGELEPQMLMVLALAIIAMLASDMERSGAVEGLTEDDIKLATGMVVAKWMEAHPDRAGMDQALQEMKKQGAMRAQQGQPNEGLLSSQAGNAGIMGAV